MLKLYRTIVGALLTCMFSTHAYSEEIYHHDFYNKQCCLIINHALGGIHGNAYTNSLEALIQNLKQGSLIFEADLAPTSDGDWVVTHDWKSWANRNKYNDPNPPNLQKFLQSRIHRENGRTYTPLTLNDLEKIFARNPDALLVLDTKYNLQDLANVLEHSKIKQQLIWQAYDFADIDFLQAYGAENIILSVYKMHIQNATQFFKYLSTKYVTKISGITVPLEFYYAHTHELTSLEIPIYIHGKPEKINSRQLHLSLRENVAGFYLD